MATRYWDGKTSDFGTASNWFQGKAPGATDTAVITGFLGVNPVTSAADVTIANLDIFSFGKSAATLDVTGGTFTAGNFSNSGTIEASGGAIDLGGATLHTVNNKGLVEATGGTVSLTGFTINQTNTHTSGTGKHLHTIAAAGTIAAVGAGSVVTLTDTTVDAGLLTSSGGGVIDTGDSNSVLNGATKNGSLTNSGTVLISDTTALTIDGSIVNSGEIFTDGLTNYTGLLIGSSPVTLSGGGEVLMTKFGYIAGAAAGATLNNVDNTITGAGIINSALNFTNEAAGVVDATVGIMGINTGNTVVNDGLIESSATGTMFVRFTTIDSSGGGSIVDGKRLWLDTATLEGGSLTVDAGATLKSGKGAATVNLGAGVVTSAGVIEGTAGGLTIDGAVENDHVLETFNGNLTVTGDVTGTGLARLLGKGDLEVDGTWGQRATFVAKSTGTLVLGDSAGFTGSIAGFSHTGTNFIDLKDVAFDPTDTATYKANKANPSSGGVLTIENGTTVLATLHLVLSDYSSSTFTLSDDGSGGTLITDPKTASLASHIASFGASSGGHATGSTSAASLTPHVLALAHAA